MSYFYVVRFPGDDPEALDWYEVHTTKKAAMRAAKLYADELDRIVVYYEKCSYDPFHGNARVIVVDQTNFLYHGA